MHDQLVTLNIIETMCKLIMLTTLVIAPCDFYTTSYAK